MSPPPRCVVNGDPVTLCDHSEMHSRVDRLNEENLHLRNRIGELEEIIGIHREKLARISSIVRKALTEWGVRSATLYEIDRIIR